MRGITTDGSSLYPKVLKKLWPDVPHQVCRFHVLMEITKAVLRALAKLRKEMKAQIPKQNPQMFNIPAGQGTEPARAESSNRSPGHKAE